MKILSLSLSFFAVALFCQMLWIDWMRRHSMGEAIKEYGPKGHMKKKGTPSMGGIVALALVPFVVLALYGLNLARAGTLVRIWSFPIAAALIGLLDDALKSRSHSSEGLKSLQKLFLQIAISLPWAYYMARGGLYIAPAWQIAPELGVPLLAFMGVGVMNAVNVTDGLDGLATGSLIITMLAMSLVARRQGVGESAILAVALLAAFLWHNANPAEVFMGDVGAHLWAGLLISLCVVERSLIFIFPLGFIFGIEMVSVTIQIIAIRKFNRKVFLMSPLHHHFEYLEWGETTIVTRFWIAHLVGLVVLFIFLFTVFERGVWVAAG